MKNINLNNDDKLFFPKIKSSNVWEWKDLGNLTLLAALFAAGASVVVAVMMGGAFPLVFIAGGLVFVGTGMVGTAWAGINWYQKRKHLIEALEIEEAEALKEKVQKKRLRSTPAVTPTTHASYDLGKIADTITDLTGPAMRPWNAIRTAAEDQFSGEHLAANAVVGGVRSFFGIIYELWAGFDVLADPDVDKALSKSQKEKAFWYDKNLESQSFKDSWLRWWWKRKKALYHLANFVSLSLALLAGSGLLLKILIGVGAAVTGAALSAPALALITTAVTFVAPIAILTFAVLGTIRWGWFLAERFVERHAIKQKIASSEEGSKEYAEAERELLENTHDIFKQSLYFISYAAVTVAAGFLLASAVTAAVAFPPAGVALALGITGSAALIVASSVMAAATTWRISGEAAGTTQFSSRAKIAGGMASVGLLMFGAAVSFLGLGSSIAFPPLAIPLVIATTVVAGLATLAAPLVAIKLANMCNAIPEKEIARKDRGALNVQHISAEEVLKNTSGLKSKLINKAPLDHGAAFENTDSSDEDVSEKKPFIKNKAESRTNTPHSFFKKTDRAPSDSQALKYDEDNLSSDENNRHGMT